MKIEIKRWDTGEVLFSHEHEHNTLRRTVEAAVLNKVSLQYADLRNADLRNASLQYASLQYADLQYASLWNASLQYASLLHADLQYADLQYASLLHADLQYASLLHADLRNAYLQYADLLHTDLRWAVGNNSEIKTLQTGTYVVAYTKHDICIGCQKHSIEEWWSFDDETISNMDYGALSWWRVWKPLLQQIIALEN